MNESIMICACEILILTIFIIAAVRTYKIMSDDGWTYFIIIFSLIVFALMVLLPALAGLNYEE